MTFLICAWPPPNTVLSTETPALPCSLRRWPWAGLAAEHSTGRQRVQFQRRWQWNAVGEVTTVMHLADSDGQTSQRHVGARSGVGFARVHVSQLTDTAVPGRLADHRDASTILRRELLVFVSTGPMRSRSRSNTALMSCRRCECRHHCRLCS